MGDQSACSTESYGYNSLGAPIAAGVLDSATGWLLSPMIAVLAMSLSSASVIFNALRLRTAAHQEATMHLRIARRLPLAGMLFALSWAGGAQAQAVPPTTRGELLYSTHCIECHTVQMHWRTHKQARDWDSLKAQVRRWQATANLAWTESDITDVARHLNETIYQFPLPQERAELSLRGSTR